MGTTMEKIISSLEINKIISIYDNKEDTSGFYCGKLCGSNNKYTMLLHYSKLGLYGGYILLKTDNIYRIEYDGQYERRVENLSSITTSQHNILVNPDDLMGTILNHAKKENLVILVELSNSDFDDVKGFVLSYDNETITVKCVNNYGYDDGISIFFIKDISVIKCDNIVCQETKLLNEHVKQI